MLTLPHLLSGRSFFTGVMKRDSIDNRGKIVVQLVIKDRRMEIRRVSYRGPNPTTDKAWRGGGGTIKGDKLNLANSVGSNGSRWEERIRLKLEQK